MPALVDGQRIRQREMAGVVVVLDVPLVNSISVLLRILLATLCGGILGVERGKANQAAGMRTHILVCLGATLIMLTGEYMFHRFATGIPVGEVTLNNPKNSGEYNAIILLKNLNEKSSSQIEEYLEHVKEIDTLKFLN